MQNFDGELMKVHARSFSRNRSIRNARHSGFTLIEIMIVVLIIGILLAIAVPNFIRAREQSRATSCVANLKQIDGATEQLVLDTHFGTTVEPLLMTYLTTTPPTGGAPYLKKMPLCPSGGVYAPWTNTNPLCSVGTNGGNGYPHVLK